MDYGSQRSKADYLISHAGQLRRAKLHKEKAILLHAALAAHVAAWDSYVKRLMREKYGAIFSTVSPGYGTLHEISRRRTEKAIEKLNTPNAENVRNFMMECSDFDPWPSWINIRFGSATLPASIMVTNRLNEVFKVRHSFAHGFTMPMFPWNTGRAGSAHLDCGTLRSVSGFLNDLAIATDSGFSIHIASRFAIAKPW
ncbi:hypothetical protein [Pseudomonas sp. IT-P2]|uniref:hypothetical protein n=1 Tax=Pseudomonas sp. IT-P2 TaxID=3026456 RepID=UPI0039E1D4C8